MILSRVWSLRRTQSMRSGDRHTLFSFRPDLVNKISIIPNGSSTNCKLHMLYARRSHKSLLINIFLFCSNAISKIKKQVHLHDYSINYGFFSNRIAESVDIWFTCRNAPLDSNILAWRRNWNLVDGLFKCTSHGLGLNLRIIILFRFWFHTFTHRF